MTPRASSRGDRRSARTSPNDAGEAFLRVIRLRRERVPSFDVYPFVLPVVRALDTLAFHPSVTFLVGENGSGKSTLLEAIAVACGFNAEGGTRAFNFATRATHSPILMAYPNATILELGERGIRPVAYEDTEHFSVTRDFLTRYPAMLKVLLDEGDE